MLNIEKAHNKKIQAQFQLLRVFANGKRLDLVSLQILEANGHQEL